MPERRRGSGGSRQPDLFARSKQPKISLPDNHPRVVLTDTVDWRRALVEGSIGTIKCSKYGFNRPAARSVPMMGVCGQRAVLGLNLTKLARGAAKNRGVALVT